MNSGAKYYTDIYITMYSKILNPQTGRMVNIKGRLGREVLKKYLGVLNGGAAFMKMPNGQQATPVSPWWQKLSQIKIPQLFKKHSRVLQDLVKKEGGIPHPGSKVGAKWQYDTLLKELVDRGIPSNDARKIIKEFWMVLFKTYKKVTRHQAEQLKLAGVNVPKLRVESPA